MKHDLLSPIIVHSIDETIVFFHSNSEKIINEEEIKLQLYHNIYSNLEGAYLPLTGEYCPFNKEEMGHNRSFSKEIGYKKDFFKRITNPKVNYQLYESKRKDKTIFEDIIKAGKYDLLVFNKEKISHVIEVKKLSKSEIHPEMANRHRPIEDIFALSDFIREYPEYFTPDCKSYNLTMVVSDHKKFKDKEDYKKTKAYLEDIAYIYEKSGINYYALILDQEIIEEAKKQHDVNLENHHCGIDLKYTKLDKKPNFNFRTFKNNKN